MLIFATGFALSVVLASATQTTAVFQGDINVYAMRLQPILDGALPYVDATFEHLPLSLLPLLAAEALAGLPGMTFGGGLTLINGALLAATLHVVTRLGEAYGQEGGPGRWLAMAVPLFPIVVFRLDPLSVLLAAVALLALEAGRGRTATLFAAMGIATRGWPVVFAAPLWRRGWRAGAVGLVAVTLALAAWLISTPGFSEGRSFTGVHIETMVGSALLFAGNLGDGTATVTHTAGAIYVGEGALPAIVNGFVGLAVAAAVVARLRRFPDTATALALLTLTLLLVSPLLSAQMLLWPTVFLAVMPAAPHRLVAAVAVVTSALLLWWYPASAWWAGAALVRNVALLAIPLLIAARAGTPQPSISRRNLPV